MKSWLDLSEKEKNKITNSFSNKFYEKKTYKKCIIVFIITIIIGAIAEQSSLDWNTDLGVAFLLVYYGIMTIDGIICFYKMIKNRIWDKEFKKYLLVHKIMK